MVKKILFFILLCFLLPRPVSVYAQTEPISTSSSQVLQSDGQVLGILDDIWGFIVTIFQVITGTYNYVAKDYEVPTIDTRMETNKYDRQDKDYSARAYSEETKKYRRGVWFHEVLTTNKYDDGVINKGDRDCGEIIVSELVYYFYTKGEKVLYKRGQTKEPIEYDGVNMRPRWLKSDSCYINAYRNIQDVPQGVFSLAEADPELEEIFSKDNGAAAASTQINENIRTIIPDNYQGETAPDNNDTGYKVRRLIQDTDKQEETMLLNFIPEKNKNLISCNDNATLNRDNIRDYFECNLNPSSWASAKCKDTSLNIDTADVGCGEKHALNGPGVSQRGAHGLGLSGYLYRDIMRLYLGNNIYFKDKEGVDDRLFTIIMIDDTDFDGDGSSDNDDNCQALVRRGIGEAYTKPDLYSGTGGYTQVDKEWKKCEEAGIYQKIQKPFLSSGPNYTLTEKCYPAIIGITLHHYLLGIAEVPHNWHLETWKALTLTHRFTALQHGGSGFLKNNSDVQVFQCNEVFHNLGTGDKATNLGIAVELTRDELAFKNNTDELANATARSAFCGPGSNNPSFDGFKYEKISYVVDGLGNGQINTNNNINGVCFEGVGYTFPPATVTSSLSSSGQVIFTTQSHQSRIKEKYDLSKTTDNQYLKSYNNDCRLDERIFPSLNQLITAFNTDNPDNQLNFISCYRSLDQQTQLYQQSLDDNGGDQYKALSEINYPGNSPHHTGRSIDFGDKYGKLTPDSSAYLWLVKNASQYGFYHHQLEPEHWDYNP